MPSEGVGKVCEVKINLYTKSDFATFGPLAAFGVRFAGGLISAPADKIEPGLTPDKTSERGSFSLSGEDGHPAGASAPEIHSVLEDPHLLRNTGEA